MKPLRPFLILLSLISLLAFARQPSPVADVGKSTAEPLASLASVAEPTPAKKVIQPVQPAERAPAASVRVNLPKTGDLATRIVSYFETAVGRRGYLQVDKPLYKPGETIWFKTWDLKTRSLSQAAIDRTTVELISPKGATVLKKRLQVVAGSASNDFELPGEAQGGEYTLRATAGDGQRIERSIIVSSYEAPRMKKKLEFIKKAYGAGDQVTASVEVKRPTGEAMGGKLLTAVITVDGIELPRAKTTTNADGGALLKFDLPKTIESGDGLLTILVEDGGITESVSKAIPLLQKKLALAFFPEGGKMVAGLPGRLYFEAKTPIGKPADIDGRLVDDLGNTVAKFSSYKNGLGRIGFTPATGRSYHAEVTRPASVSEKFALPLVEEQGCVLRSYDDVDGQAPALRVSVLCSQAQKVVVAATVRENLLDVASVQAGPDAPGVVWLKSKDAALNQAAGVARVTLFDADLTPLAERLVFRNRRTQLQVKVETARKSYAPRDQVALNITTRDANGKPTPAELALAVVDDTVIAFADDKSGHLLAKLLLEAELPGKIEEPNFYVDLTEAKSGLALDLLMGARGYRRFDWVRVLTQPDYQVRQSMMRNKVATVAKPMPAAPMPLAAPMPAAPPPPVPAAVAAPRAQAVRAPLPEPVPLVAQARPNQAPVVAHQAQPPGGAKAVEVDNMRMRREARAPAGLLAKEEAAAPLKQDRNERKNMADEKIMEDKDFAGKRKMAAFAPAPEQWVWAVVRVFPVPAHSPGYAGVRDDYRETVFWAPSVKTDANGKASVQFVLSDAVTSFRVFSEGVGAGLAGRDETVFKSSLPFSLSAKLPLEVSAGDKPLIPITLTNDSDQALNIKLDTDFGKLIKAAGQTLPAGSLAAGQRKSVFVPLEVTGVRGLAQVNLAAASGGLKDEVLRTIPVAPLGFPQLIEKSGQVKTVVSHEVDLSAANPGSVQASVQIYTSPLSSMISGLDGMLREPHGCFEQTSSTNYPNVMIMQYMKQHEVADLKLLERSGKLLDSGYKKLAGFESKNKGYEWFGGDPGHEALTAYGLLEFADMKDVYGSVDTAMLARTAAWLKSRRDGNGGYLRDAKALDSFGRAAPAVTDAYITWALVSAQETGLDKEIDKSAKLAESTQDAYQLALATGTLLGANGSNGIKGSHGTNGKNSAWAKAGMAAAAKLAKMQSASGEWRNADHSITRSGGVNLQIETTSLAILALLKTDAHLEVARKGIAWLQNNRSGFGQWGATQATVLALKAIIAFDDATRVAPAAGSVSLLVDGVVVAEQAYEAGRREPIVFSGFEQKLRAGGKHTISLRSKSGVALPYSMALEYRSNAPASSKAAVVSLSATLEKSEIKMGETVRMNAVISNVTQTGQPMMLARLGLPGGLTFQTWQLKELREKGQIAFFETRAREVILYFRDMKPGEVKKIALDWVATVPGSYTGPASSAYLYYNDSDKSWGAPVAIKISPQ